MIWVYVYFGGCVAQAIQMASMDRTTNHGHLLGVLLGIAVASVFWPVNVLSPIVKWLALRRGWFHSHKMYCRVCDSEGVGFIIDESMFSPPDGWYLVSIRDSIFLVCSTACGKHLRVCPGHEH